MKLKTLVESKEALTSLLKSSLPISIAWELKKFVKITSPELLSYEELRNQKIVEMGNIILDEKSKPTQDYKVKDENLPEYTRIVMELLEKEIDVTIPKIKFNDLINYKDINGKGISITTTDLLILDWLINE